LVKVITKEASMDDRRRHARIRSNTIMQYKDGFFSAVVDTATKDVSLGGICFFTEKKLRKGQVIKIKLYYDEKVPAKTVKGKVAWSSKSNDGPLKGYLNGLSFIQ